MDFGDLNLLNSTSLPKTDNSAINTALTDAFILLGAISLLMLVIAGLRYILARGNAESTAQARNMITYSVIGLIVAALASTIVNFVLGNTG
jgi:hypothetical protein